ncbi:hypothetical protein E2C01_066208 [Portunus trituberculatus]|uniref:Uncharacterized protein n=1 Tax=Portunus trituberculatus TaxID=210409 RepID=A0A5B7HPN4_PORTR|nr:hypothetical protein [Portunus trituberculatus]
MNFGSMNALIITFMFSEHLFLVGTVKRPRKPRDAVKAPNRGPLVYALTVDHYTSESQGRLI